MKGKLVLIIGPSGVGKSVILKRLKQLHPEFVFPRSATTRERRRREGTDLYHFISQEEFTRLERDQKFLETAQVHRSARYGTLLSEILPPIENGRTVVREVDVQGFESIRSNPLFAGNNAPYHLQTIFILPESEKQLTDHITHRAPITQEELKRRIESVQRELNAAPMTDVQIHNCEGKLDETIQKVDKAISSYKT